MIKRNYRKSKSSKKIVTLIGVLLGSLAIFTSYFYIRYGVSPVEYFTLVKPTVNCIGGRTGDCWSSDPIQISGKIETTKDEDGKLTVKYKENKEDRTIITSTKTSGSGVTVTETVVKDENGKEIVNRRTDEQTSDEGITKSFTKDIRTNDAGEKSVFTTNTTLNDKGSVLEKRYFTIDENNNPTEIFNSDIIARTSSPTPAVSQPATTVFSQSCPGANSGIGGSQWAQTGGGVEGTDIRYCVQCGGSRSDGKAGAGVWGDQVVECGKGDAVHYIVRPDQVVENGVANNCWANNSWYADSTVQGGSSFCNNGVWQSKDEFVASKSEKCGPNSLFDLTTLTCQAKPVAVITPVQNGPQSIITKPSLTANKGKDCTKDFCTKNECEVSMNNTASSDVCTPIQGTDKYGLVDKDFLTVGGALNTSGGKPGTGVRYMYDFTLGGSVQGGIKPLSTQLPQTPIEFFQDKPVRATMSTGTGALVGGMTGVGACAATGILMLASPVCGLVGAGIGAYAGNTVGNNLSNAQELINDPSLPNNPIEFFQDKPVRATMSTGTGIAAGCLAGSMAGSVVPIFGNAVGCIVGGLAGGYLGNTVGNNLSNAQELINGNYHLQ